MLSLTKSNQFVSGLKSQAQEVLAPKSKIHMPVAVML